MTTLARPPVPVVVRQHAEDAAVLRNSRSFLVDAPHARLHQLARLDERLAAHLDGLAIAGAYGTRLAMEALATPGRGEVFTATVRPLQEGDAAGLRRLIDLADALPQLRPAVVSAFGWVPPASLRGVTRALLEASDPWPRALGLAACAMHGADPGPALAAGLRDPDAGLRARAFRTAAMLGQVQYLPACIDALDDEDPACAFQAAEAAVLLGERRMVAVALARMAAAAGPARRRALVWLLLLCTAPEAHALLRDLAQDAANARLLIHGVAAFGDPHYVPWLIQQMADPLLTRVAGEAFSHITGLDLAWLDLDRKPPEAGASADTDTGNDADGEEDDSLPWPDPERIRAWWQAHGQRWRTGTRYFMGEPPSPAHCLAVLRDGFQRQRATAAAYRCFMAPGTPLFNTAAPAWRQQRWLDAMQA